MRHGAYGKSLSENLKKKVYLGEIRIDPHILNPRAQCKYYQAENSTFLHSASWILKQNSKNIFPVEYRFVIDIPLFGNLRGVMRQFSELNVSLCGLATGFTKGTLSFRALC